MRVPGLPLCREVAEEAADLLEGRARPGRALLLRLHLLLCSACRGFLRQLRQVSRLLRRAPRLPPSAQVEEALLRAFRERGR